MKYQARKTIINKLLNVTWKKTIPVQVIANILADLWEIGTPRSVVIEILKSLWKKNNSVFFDSDLSWFKILTSRKGF